MLSQEIEQKYLTEQLKDVEKDIKSLTADLEQVKYFTKIKELELEKKNNLKISLEKRLEKLKQNDNSLASYMSDDTVVKNDRQFITNENKMNINIAQMESYDNQLKSTKNIFKKADITIQRKKLEVCNKLLGKKNVVIERKQRMYIGFTRKIEAMKNSPQNFKVSINNIHLEKMQNKYEERINKTFELEEYQKQMVSEGHKIRSKILGKAVSFSNRSDDRVREKYQKLLSTKEDLIKLESARQFYDSYDFSLNESKVLQGERLKHDDIIDNIIKGDDGNLYYHYTNGNMQMVPPEMFEEVASKYGFKYDDDSKKRIA